MRCDRTRVRPAQPAWASGSGRDVEGEVGRVVVGDLVALALGAVELRQPAADLLAERQARPRLRGASRGRPSTSSSALRAKSAGAGALTPRAMTECGNLW